MVQSQSENDLENVESWLKMQSPWDANLPYPGLHSLASSSSSLKADPNASPELEVYLDEFILNNLNASHAAGDWTACQYHSRVLSSLLELKAVIPLTLRVRFIQFYYNELLGGHSISDHSSGMSGESRHLMSEYPIQLIKTTISILIRLLKKRPEELVEAGLSLQWKYLLQWITPYLPKTGGTGETSFDDTTSEGDMGGEDEGQLCRPFPGRVKQIKNLTILIGYARPFFPADVCCIQVLDAFLPMLNLNRLNHWIQYQALLALFLPEKPLRIPLVSGYEENPEFMPSFPWISLIFRMWKMVTNIPALDGIYLSKISRLTKENYGHPHVLKWTTDQINFIVAKSFSQMEIPIGTSTTGKSNGGASVIAVNINSDFLSSFEGILEDRIDTLTQFIIYCIYPSEQQDFSNINDTLELFLRATEPFYHPSNSGRWSNSLCRFLGSLCRMYFSRVEMERLKCKVPESYRLNADCHVRFVDALLPLLMSSMFGKDQKALNQVFRALRCLALLCPDQVFSKLLPIAVPALESVVESHRMLSSLTCLYTTIPPLVTTSIFPEGCAYIIPIMELVLPGIDMNDPAKTVSSLIFLSHVALSIPFADISAAPFKMPSNLPAQVEDALYRARSETFRFRPFLVSYLDRVFLLLENLPAQHGASAESGSLETSVLSMLIYSTSSIFDALSDDLEDLAIQKLITFVKSNVIANATKAVGLLITCLANRNPAKKLVFLSEFIDRVLVLQADIETGSSNPSLPFGFNRLSDSPYHWNQTVVYSIIANSGSGVLDFVGKLEKLFDFSNICSKVGYKWAAKTLRSLIESLSTIYPHSSVYGFGQSVPDVQAREEATINWGLSGNLQDLGMQWHIPTDQELNIALDLMEKYSKLAMKHLTYLLDGQNHMDLDSPNSNASQTKSSSLDAEKWLTVLKAIVMAGMSFLSPWEDIERLPIATHLPVEVAARLANLVRSGYATDPAIRQRALGLRRELVDFLISMECFADDVDALILHGKCIGAVGTYGMDMSESTSSLIAYKYGKALLSKSSELKLLPKAMCEKRVFILHQARLKQNIFLANATPAGKLEARKPYLEVMMKKLLTLSLSKYAIVRQRNQGSLKSLLGVYPSYRTFIARELLAVVSGSDDPELLKGALYIFKINVILTTYLTHQELLFSLMRTLVDMKHNDKLSLLENLCRLFLDIFKTFTGPPAPCPRVNYFGSNGPFSGDYVAQYSQFSAHVLDVADRLHWRIRLLSFSTLRNLCPGHVSSDLLAYLESTLLSDHPHFRKMAKNFIMQLMTKSYHGLTVLGSNWNDKARIRLSADQLALYLDACAGRSSLQDPILLRIKQLEVGWLCFPDTKSQSSQNSSRDIDMSKPPIQLPLFENEAFWLSYFGHASLENDRSFDESNVRFYKLIFKSLLRIPSILYQLLESKLSTADKSLTRALVELFAAILIASTSQPETWTGFISPSSSVDDAQSWAVTYFERGLASSTLETFPIWAAGLSSICKHRDPQSLIFLFKGILNSSVDPHATPISSMKRLTIIRILFSLFQWKLTNFIPEVFASNLLLTSPFDQVRRATTGLLSDLLNLELFPRLSDSTEVLHWSLKSHVTCGDVALKFASDISNGDTLNESTDVCKSVCAFVVEMIMSCKTHVVSTLLPVFLPYIIQWTCHGDVECQQTSGRILKVYGMYFYNMEVLSKILNVCVKVLKAVPIPDNAEQGSNFHWKMKCHVLTLLQVLVFKHLFSWTNEQLSLIISTVADLLSDVQVEVRLLASITLSGLIRLSHESVVDNLRIRFLVRWSAKTRTLENQQRALGLSALILSTPYNVPDWLPEVMVTLTTYTRDSNAKKTVMDTFSEFKRTHLESWDDVKSAFSPDDFELISEYFSSPSYYA